LDGQTVGVDQNHTEKVSWRHADASGKTERWATVGSVAGINGRSPDYAELNADGMSLPVNNFDDGSLNLPEPIGKFQRINGEMVMGGGGCEFEGEAISCSMVEGLKEYQAMVSSSGKKKEEKKGVSITIIRESGRTQDSSIWHSPAKDKSSGLAYNPANVRANPSSLSTVTYQATQPLATVQSEQSLEDWLEQLWTKPVNQNVNRRAFLFTDCNKKVLVEVSVSDSGDGATSKRPYMNAAVVDDFNAALKEIHDGGFIAGPGFNELFRPFSVQEEYWKAYKNNGFKPIGRIQKAANTDKTPYPGPSNHGAGFAFDISIRNRGLEGEPYSPHYKHKLTEGPNKGKTVEQIFNNHGFYRNEPKDEPHFNYKIKPTAADKLAAQNYWRDCLKDKETNL
jgi:D-alanyl-D-alanine carboxypeptidase